MTVVVVYWFDRLSLKNTELQPVIAGLNKTLFYLGLICIAIILLAGYGRTFYPNDVKKIFDKTREKERIKQLSKMYLILFAVLFPVIYLKYGSIAGMENELVYLGIVCLLVMLPLEAERSIRFRYIGNTYGGDLNDLERIWKKMMIIWHVVLLSALGVGTYFQYVTAFRF
jgi:hypothetical protein